MASRIDIVNFSNNLSSVVVSNNSTISNTTDADNRWSFEFSVILATILSISAFFTIVGNSMVLMVIIRHRGMRTRTNLFLVNLAVADLLVGLFVVPFTITTLIENHWIFGHVMCLLNGWMNSFCLITSFHTLMYISVHKYFSIVRPLSNSLKLTYILSMMAAAWIWAAVCSTLNITILVVLHKPGTSQCGPRYPNNLEMFAIHGVIQLTVIVLPAFILVFCYLRMFMEIRKHSQRLRTNSTVEEDFILSQQKKVAITLFIVLATFVMMALPYHIYATYTTIKKDKEHFSSYINPLAYMFLYLSSMCNPIIYAFRSPAFRQGYKEILCHTPNYVISDDSEYATRTRRLSSLISTLRHGSIGEGRNSVHYSDNRALSVLTPESENPRSGKQKSLFKLLRSTRQSTAQSVVHRNGDIIIMKGGKIVSVRRAGEGREGSPLLDRLKTLRDTTECGTDLLSGLAGPGHVMFGLICDGPAKEEEDLVKKRDSGNISEGSDDVFSRVGSVKTPDHSNMLNMDEVFHGCQESDKGKSDISNRSKDEIIVDSGELIRETAKVTKRDASKAVKFAFNSVNFSSNNLENPPCSKNFTNQISSSDLPEDHMADRNNKTDLPKLLKTLDEISVAGEDDVCSGSSGVVIHLDEEDDVLSIMPLTPHTRECLMKSDLRVSQTNPNIARSHDGPAVATVMQGSKSTENLFRRPPAAHRQMSVEFLDPPIHLFRSKSNAGRRRKEESRSRVKKIHSPESKSKPPSLQPPFSTKKTITQV